MSIFTLSNFVEAFIDVVRQHRIFGMLPKILKSLNFCQNVMFGIKINRKVQVEEGLPFTNIFTM